MGTVKINWGGSAWTPGGGITYNGIVTRICVRCGCTFACSYGSHVTLCSRCRELLAEPTPIYDGLMEGSTWDPVLARERGAP